MQYEEPRVELQDHEAIVSFWDHRFSKHKEVEILAPKISTMIVHTHAALVITINNDISSIQTSNTHH